MSNSKLTSVEKMKFYNRIRFKIAFGFLIVTLIPATIIGFYADHVSTATLLTQEYNNQKDLISSLDNSIKSFLGSTEDDVLFLSQSHPMQRYLSEKSNDSYNDDIEQLKKNIAQEFLAFSKQRKIYYQIRYLDENGQEIVRIDSNKRNSHIVRSRKLQNKGDRGYFKKSVDIALGDVFVSRLDLNREHGKVEMPHKPVIRYATPVQYTSGLNQGKSAGIIITNVAASVFLNQIEDTALVDSNGFYMTGVKQDKLWGSNQDLNSNENFISDHKEISERIFGVQSGQFNDKDSAYIFTRVNVPGASYNWYLIAQKPMGTILASVKDFRITFLSILTASIFIALLIAWIVDSRITRPIEDLTDMADKVSKGQLMIKVDVSDKGEIGELAHAFERMRVSMVKAFERMKKR
ncbi:MAG: HAMP domain-containing protein [Gammaproteobacteria bacterium]|nr:HAMP domain-containing protein [Gammaproteobacteria bacterium]